MISPDLALFLLDGGGGGGGGGGVERVGGSLQTK